MQKLQESIHINAPAAKVWDVLFTDATYREWSKAFSEGGSGSGFEGDWSEGSEMRFVGPDPETGEIGGMASRIAENKPHERLVISHYGIVKNGVVDSTSDEAKKWVPSEEAYTLTEKDGGTELAIDQDMGEEFAESFSNSWKDALQRIKALAEAA